MNNLFALLSRLAAWALSLFQQRERAAGATEEREKISQDNAARLERQDAVIERPVTDEALQKSLRDGSF